MGVFVAQQRKENNMNKLRDLLASEPLRMRAYTIMAVVVGYLVATGKVESSLGNAVETVAGLVLGVVVTENTRAHVSPA